MDAKDLDALAALVVRMESCGCPSAYLGMLCKACVADARHLRNSAPDLLRLAREALEARERKHDD